MLGLLVFFLYFRIFFLIFLGIFILYLKNISDLTNVLKGTDY
jgi:hypothetical protein